MDDEFIREVVFGLVYIQHGGSGLGLSYQDVLALDWLEAAWYAERLNTQRSREAKAIKDSSGRRR